MVSAAPEARGLESVVAAETRLGAIDGTAGTLHYAGYAIDDLATKASFEEVFYLLLHGELPTKKQIAALRAEMAAAEQDREAIALIHSLPATGMPIDAVRTAVSALGQLDPNAEDLSMENARRIGVRLAGLMPIALASAERRSHGLDPVPPRPDLRHAANILQLLHGKMPTPTAERAMNTYLVLLAEHGLNASTFAARVATGASADMYCAITAAVATLKGDAHGGANRRAMEMFLEIGSPDRVDAFIEEALASKRRLMGIGHRIYKTRDPRARHLEDLARELADETGDHRAYEVARRIEEVTASHPYYVERKLYPNVEFFTAPVLYGLGLRPELMPAAFALSRIAGWTAHVLEQLADNRLIRPSARYVGPAPRPYVPLEQRG
ncbi:MAG TPA: citrate/2-methylcitrate synthase [Chloroflexota bacterium]|nr:citrate/2-methylcitrate synthase [Chloroflexota bacterium]